MLDGFLTESILGRGIEAGHLAVDVHDLRKWTTDKHRTADDRPFGGGAGMVLKPEPVFAAIEQLQTPGCRRIYLTPDGIPLSPALALDRLPRSVHVLSADFLRPFGVLRRARDAGAQKPYARIRYMNEEGTAQAGERLARICSVLDRWPLLSTTGRLCHVSFRLEQMASPAFLAASV
jgi:tRNA (guanine37-N1)-methyltransferase